MGWELQCRFRAMNYRSDVHNGVAEDGSQRVGADEIGQGDDGVADQDQPDTFVPELGIAHMVGEGDPASCSCSRSANHRLTNVSG